MIYVPVRVTLLPLPLHHRRLLGEAPRRAGLRNNTHTNNNNYNKDNNHTNTDTNQHNDNNHNNEHHHT